MGVLVSARGYNHVVTTGMELDGRRKQRRSRNVKIKCKKQTNKKKRIKLGMETFETGQNGRHATGCRTFNRKTVSEITRRVAPSPRR